MKTAKRLVATCSLLALAWTSAAAAQEPPSAQRGQEMQEIIVTARKRQESILNVPVIATAVTQTQLERVQTQDLKDLQKMVPGLSVGHGMLAIGALVSIRGIGTASLDPGIDQSVSLNLDGMPVGQGLAFSSGMFDVGQVEVLKGPQALFYGKSSPGGVISLRTADPTSESEVTARAGYEFEARERRGELIVSGSLTETLRGRLAGYYSESDGYFKNTAYPASGTGALAPAHGRASNAENYMIRGTLLWNPSSQFNARLKVNYVHDLAFNADAYQLVSCPDGITAPFGVPFIGGAEDCKLDRNMPIVDMDPAFFPGIIGRSPFVESTQKYGTLELNYEVRANLTLTSTTGVYQLDSDSLANTSQTSFAAPALSFQNRFKRRDLTQEVRLNSDFRSPLNFTVGAFYQDGRVSDRVTAIANRAILPPEFLPLLDSDGETPVDIKTYSAFGQLRWQITPQLELAAGARYTDEKRTETPLSYAGGVATPIPVRNPDLHTTNTAPEVTLTYRATDDLTLFAAYKRGYKSGSFSMATVPLPGSDNSFGDERVEGGEVGLKSRLLDRQLSLNAAVYDYRYQGLQVGAVEPPQGGLIIIRTVNAGSARVFGAELDFAYRPIQIDGLSLRGSLNWNRGRFKSLNNVPCYNGQLISEGCNQRAPGDPTGPFVAQDLSGTPLVRAPDWQANFGFDYEMAIGGSRDLTLVVSNSNQYSSRYVTFLGARDDKYQDAFLKTDLSLALQGPDNRWELALIGKNITDEITSSSCSPINASGGVIFGGGAFGGTMRGPAGVDEVGCFADRGREVWVRFTYRPFAGG